MITLSLDIRKGWTESYKENGWLLYLEQVQYQKNHPWNITGSFCSNYKNLFIYNHEESLENTSRRGQSQSRSITLWSDTDVLFSIAWEEKKPSKLLSYSTILYSKTKSKKVDTKRLWHPAHRFLSSTTGYLSKSANWILPTTEKPESIPKNS